MSRIFIMLLALVALHVAKADVNLCESAFSKISSDKADQVQTPQNPIYSDLLKLPFETQPDMRLIDDYFEMSKNLLYKQKLTIQSNPEARLRSLANYRIAAIFAAPGHRALRNPGNVRQLADYIKTSNGGDFSHDPIVLNIIIENGKVTSVDLWNAHHRLVAYLEAGYKTIGQIAPQNIKILINGNTGTTETEKWAHFLSAGGLSLTTLAATPKSVVPAYGDIRIGTVSVDGSWSNRQLGSRNSIGALAKNTQRNAKYSPKIGVYFGTFDPIHEGHVELIKFAKAQLGLDEVVVIPNGNAVHKPNASSLAVRLQMLAARISPLEGVNLMTGDTSLITDQFGREPLFEKIKQIYGSEDIVQIVGQDSYEKLLNENVITSSSKIKYLVFARAGENSLVIPEELSQVVQVATKYKDTGESSTMVRNAIKNKTTVPPSLVHKAVLKVIQTLGLYK